MQREDSEVRIKASTLAATSEMRRVEEVDEGREEAGEAGARDKIIEKARTQEVGKVVAPISKTTRGRVIANTRAVESESRCESVSKSFGDPLRRGARAWYRFRAIAVLLLIVMSAVGSLSACSEIPPKSSSSIDSAQAGSGLSSQTQNPSRAPSPSIHASPSWSLSPTQSQPPSSSHEQSQSATPSPTQSQSAIPSPTQSQPASPSPFVSQGSSNNPQHSTNSHTPAAKPTKPSYEEITAKTEEKLSELKSNCRSSLMSIGMRYLTAKEESEQNRLKEQAASELASCQSRFDKVMADTKRELTKNGYKTAVLQEYRKSFQAELDAGRRQAEALLK